MSVYSWTPTCSGVEKVERNDERRFDYKSRCLTAVIWAAGLSRADPKTLCPLHNALGSWHRKLCSYENLDGMMDGKWVVWESETKLGVPAQELVCTGLGEDRPAGISLQATATLPLVVFQDGPHSCAPVLPLLHHPQDLSGRRPTPQLTSTTLVPPVSQGEVVL